MASKTPWTIQLFGGLRVSSPEIVVDRFPTRRSALLLARVALSRSGSSGRDELAETLWPDDFLDATRLRLRQELNRLRDALGPAAEILVSDRSWVRLDLERASVDTREFERLLTQAKSEASQERRQELRLRALSLYAGALLPEQSEDWIHAERQEFHAKHLAALIEQTDELLAENSIQDALAFALRAVRADAFHEPARIAAMRAFAALGDFAGAVRQYVEYERALLREFSARPSEAMQRLEVELRKPASAEKSPPAEVAEPAVHPAALAPLPVFMDAIVGRESEVAAISGWLCGSSPVRLATITGAGGVGKTRLAVAVADSLRDAFGGRTVYVALGDVESGQDVAGKLQRALGAHAPADDSEPLPGWGDERCLLVFDNAEHVLNEVRVLVKNILVAHRGACILATSRQRLGLGGEQEFPLAPLALPDPVAGENFLESSPAARLFVERARASRPGFDLDESQLEPLAMLLGRLDGLPLAIELAAARIGFLSPEQMLDEIDDRFTFLVSRRSDVEPRQRSLRATIDWSFRGLDADLRAVLGTLATFRGGWTVEMSRQATGRPDIVDLLHDLSERSLVHRDESAAGSRFAMLETIRDYVLGELTKEEWESSRRAHASVVAELVFGSSRELTGPNQEQAAATLRAEADNARAAIEWAVEKDPDIAAKLGAGMWRFWCAQGLTAEGEALLDRILSRKPSNPSPEWAEAMLGRGIVSAVIGDASESGRWIEASAAMFEELNLPRAVSWAKMNLANSRLAEGRPQEAYDLGLRGLDEAGEYNRALCHEIMALALARLGRTEEAMSVAEAAFAEAVGSHDPARCGRAYASLADVYVDCGRYEGVQGLLTEAIERLTPTPVRNWLLEAQISLAREHLRREDFEAFERAAGDAAKIAADMRETASDRTLDALRARCLAMQGNLPAALRAYESALKGALSRPSAMTVMQICRMLALDLARGGSLETARSVLAAERSLRSSLGCGLSVDEAREVALAESLIGELGSASDIRSAQELGAKALTESAKIR